MSLTAAAIRMLADKGLTASEIADLAEANTPGRSSAAVRQKRYRDNKRDVTRDVTPPPIEKDHTPPSNSEPYGSDTASPVEPQVQVNPEKVMFDAGRRLLDDAGVPKSRQGAILGKWKRDHGAEAVIIALGKAQREGAIDPVSFIEGCFKHGAGHPRKFNHHEHQEQRGSVTNRAFEAAYADLGVGPARGAPSTPWDGSGNRDPEGSGIRTISPHSPNTTAIRGDAYAGSGSLRLVGNAGG